MIVLKKTLCFAYGNPSRGDDALGLTLLDYLEAQAFNSVESLYDMQLQVDDITELVGRKKIIFIDADMSCGAPFHYSQISAHKDNSYTSHAMSPEALLYAYQTTYKEAAPAAYMLRIRGYQFGLGQPLSVAAEANLTAAKSFIIQTIKTDKTPAYGDCGFSRSVP